MTPEYLPDFWSGMRLHATYDDAGNGVRHFTGFWDTKLGVACEYPRARNGVGIARAADGQVRCLPVTPFRYEWVYLDAACKQRALMTVGIAPPPYATDVTEGVPTAECTGGTPDIANVYAVGKALRESPSSQKQAGAVAPLFMSSGGTCKAYAPANANDASDYENDSRVFALRPVSPATFSAAKEYDAPRTLRLSARYHEGEDGSLQFWSLVDTERGEPCNDFGQGKDMGTRCFPSEFATAGIYEDAACTKDAAIRDVAGFCLPPKTAVDGDGALFGIGSQLMSGYTHDEVTGAATGVIAASVGATMWSLGSPLTKEDLPALSVITDRSSALAAPFMMSVEGTHLGPSRAFGPFLNTLTNERCAPSHAFGDTRCVPLSWGLRDAPLGVVAAPSTELYADPSCVQPVTAWGQPFNPDAYVFDGSKYAYPVQGRITSGSLYSGSSGTKCTKGPSVETGFSYVALGPRVDITTLPLIKHVTE